MRTLIEPLSAENVDEARAHFDRHRAESGRGDPHFMPFEPDDPEGPRGLDAEALVRPLTERGWQRWFIARDTSSTVVGHVNLEGDGLAVGLHRCELGIGIERPHRGHGLGRRLVSTAIEYAREVESLAWIDLRAFAHNEAALALYRSLGFVEMGRLEDRFRIGATSVDDVIMALDVAGRGADVHRKAAILAATEGEPTR